MTKPDILSARGDSARGDKLADVAGSLRGILSDRDRYERLQSILYGVLFVGIAAVIAMVVLVVMGHSLAAAWVGGGALLLAVVARFYTATQGASVLLGSAAGAVIAATAVGFQIDVTWLDLGLAVAAVGVTLIPINRRRTRLPVVPVMAAGQWTTVALMFLTQWIPIVPPALALVLCSVLAWAVADRAADQRVMRAKSRSQIQTAAMPVESLSLGVRIPPPMSVRNIEVGIEAEQATAEELSNLGAEYIVLHSRRIPASNADLDHIVIGPHGVALVDSKYRTGEMTYRELDFETVDDSVVPSTDPTHAPLQEAAVKAADEADDAAPADHPDEALSPAALEARQRAYEVFRVSEFAGKRTRVGEWHLNGFPASAALASSTSWEASQIEKALKMPEGTTIPALLSIYGARMDRESATIPLFDKVGLHERDAIVCHVRAIAEEIRQLPRILADQTKIDDLAVVVDDLFPRA